MNKRVLIILVLAVGCRSEEAPTAPTDGPRTMPTQLTNIDAFAVEHRDGVRAVAASLGAGGDRAEEFFAEVEPEAGGQVLVFHVWHESAFEPRNRGAVGNPGGKCRDMKYDVRERRVTQTLFWQ
jgi:hypothetical protein